jgi:hypothetical protein
MRVDASGVRSQAHLCSAGSAGTQAEQSLRCVHVLWREGPAGVAGAGAAGCAAPNARGVPGGIQTR